MEQPVLVKSFANGITLVCEKEASFTEILDAVTDKFEHSGRFFAGSHLALRLEGREFSDMEKIRLVRAIEESASTEIIDVIDAAQEDSAALVKEYKGLKEELPDMLRVIKGPVRSGVELEGSSGVLVDGNVHVGAQIRSEGSIIVMGSLEGCAHAGYHGKRDSFIAAMDFDPEGIQIGPGEIVRTGLMKGRSLVVRKENGEFQSQTLDFPFVPEQVQPDKSKVYWFFGVGRNVGNTSIVLHTASYWARHGKKILLLDMSGGKDNLAARFGIDDNAVFLLKNLLKDQCSFFQAALRPKQLPDVTLVSSKKPLLFLNKDMQNGLHLLFAAVKNEFDFILVDASDSDDSVVRTACKEEGRKIVVSTDDFTSLSDADYFISRLQDRGESPVALVNRCKGKDLEDVKMASRMQKRLEIPIIECISEDPHVSVAEKRGVPVSPKSSFGEGITVLCNTLTGTISTLFATPSAVKTETSLKTSPSDVQLPKSIDASAILSRLRSHNRK